MQGVKNAMTPSSVYGCQFVFLLDNSDMRFILNRISFRYFGQVLSPVGERSVSICIYFLADVELGFAVVERKHICKTDAWSLGL